MSKLRILCNGYDHNTASVPLNQLFRRIMNDYQSRRRYRSCSVSQFGFSVRYVPKFEGMSLVKPLSCVICSVKPVGVAVLVHRKKYLIAKRSGHVPHSGYWEFPGGKVEAGETVSAAIIRECSEELGVHVKLSKKIIEFQWSYGDARFLLIAYLARYDGSPLRAAVHDEFRWVNLGDCHQMQMLPSNLTIVRALSTMNT